MDDEEATNAWHRSGNIDGDAMTLGLVDKTIDRRGSGRVQAAAVESRIWIAEKSMT